VMRISSPSVVISSNSTIKLIFTLIIVKMEQ
jgi:hypothetical protein